MAGEMEPRALSRPLQRQPRSLSAGILGHLTRDATSSSAVDQGLAGVDGSVMNRRGRRHPDLVDPVTEAQGDARWSIFTIGIRQPLSFRADSVPGARIALVVTVAPAMLMVGVIYLAVMVLSKVL